ncbi:MFS transporter [Arthrobacter crystallopoietes]|uniref:MFS transporter n=1 Tax=Crystallibacter crystallopoietes TaxID=37928 RepID=UPI003D231CC7
MSSPPHTGASVTQPEAGSASRVNIRKRQIAVGIGNFMEWFDFAIYGYFVAVIGAQFFPSGNPTTEMLSSFAVFAVGFVARPLGALLLGPVGDRAGRKAVLVITVLGMGITTALIGLTPSYAAIGVAAPVIIVILRCVQGMMVGGEWSTAAAYLGESAPPKKRGLHASLVTATAGAAFLVGTLVATLINAVLPPEQVASWGWRIPFIASLLMAAVAVFIRQKLEDTPVYEELTRRREENQVQRVAGKVKATAFVLTMAFSALFGVSLYYFITYANNHLSNVVGMPRVEALLACGIALIVYVIANPLFGALSDHIGRRPVVLAAATGLTLFGIPVFLGMNTGSFPAVLISLTVLGLLVAMSAVMNVVLLVEVFPASIRSTGSALGYNVAFALLAGPGPLIAAGLMASTGNPVSPGFYLVGVSLASLIVLWAMLPETKSNDISRG